jgi:hypothetical protein
MTDYIIHGGCLCGALRISGIGLAADFKDTNSLEPPSQKPRIAIVLSLSFDATAKQR